MTRTSSSCSRSSRLAAVVLAFAAAAPDAAAIGTLNYSTSLGPSFWLHTLGASGNFPQETPETKNPFLRRREIQDEEDEGYFEPEPEPSDVSWNLGYAFTLNSGDDPTQPGTDESFHTHAFRAGLGWQALEELDFAGGASAETTPATEYRVGGFDLSVGYTFAFNPEEKKKRGRRKKELPSYLRHVEGFLHKHDREQRKRSELDPDAKLWYLYVGVSWTFTRHILQAVASKPDISQRGISLDVTLTPDPEWSVGAGVTKYLYNKDPEGFLAFLGREGAIPTGLAGFSATVQGFPDLTVSLTGSYYVEVDWSIGVDLALTRYPQEDRASLISVAPSVRHVLNDRWSLTGGLAFHTVSPETSIVAAAGFSHQL